VTSAAATLSDSKDASRPDSWLARLTELLMVGGGTLLLFPLAWLLRRSLGPDPSETAVDYLAFHAALVINNPHFAVTYLLFYKDARSRALGPAFPPWQRARYIAAGFVIPLALMAWAISALQTGSVSSMGLMIELMFLLVGWHYVKQGFGILTVLSLRRGFRFGALERKVILFHCYAGWAYAWASPSAPSRESAEKGVIYMSLPHPRALEIVTGVAFGLSAVALIAVLALRWKRERKAPPPAPLIGFVVTIWLWTVYTSIDRLMMYIIPALHSVQYLYMVWLLKRNEAREAEGPPLFGRPTALRLGILAVSAIALGWVLFRGVPGFLDSSLVLASTPGDRTLSLGETPYFAAIFVFVNIHHYFMDTVIWRRENPETRHLRA
jgi:hypothetical protein